MSCHLYYHTTCTLGYFRAVPSWHASRRSRRQLPNFISHACEYALSGTGTIESESDTTQTYGTMVSCFAPNRNAIILLYHDRSRIYSNSPYIRTWGNSALPVVSQSHGVEPCCLLRSFPPFCSTSGLRVHRKRRTKTVWSIR